MKHLLIYGLVSAMLVSFDSCSKKENPAVDDDNLLIGTWETVRAVEREYIDDELSYEIDTENPDDHFTFDMKIRFIDHNRVRITGEDIDGTVETTYSLSADGKKLSIKDVDEAFESIQIKKLTSADMEWFIEGAEHIDGDEVDRQVVNYQMEVYLKRGN